MKLRIKEVAQKKGITLKEIAEKIGVTVSMMTFYGTEEKSPPLYRLEDIAKVLDCNVHELLPTEKKYSHFYDNDTGEWLGIRKK